MLLYFVLYSIKIKKNKSVKKFQLESIYFIDTNLNFYEIYKNIPSIMNIFKIQTLEKLHFYLKLFVHFFELYLIDLIRLLREFRIFLLYYL